MAKTLHEMAVKLQEYIIDKLSGTRGTARANLQRYNNLKLKMEAKDYPHVIISIGISQVTYNLDSVTRIDGGLGSDEKWVKRWLSSGAAVSELKAIYTEFQQSVKEAKAEMQQQVKQENAKKQEIELEKEGQAFDVNFKKIEQKEAKRRNRSIYQRTQKK